MKKSILILVVLSLMLMLFTGCGPGNVRWDQVANPGVKANFWAGIWHGLIIVVTFIVSLFTDRVGIYEVNNIGWPYNLGFIIGVAIAFSGLFRCKKRRMKMKREHSAEMASRIEEKVRQGIKAWLDETKKEEREQEWKEIGDRIEEKIKKSIKEWLDKAP